MSAAPSSDPAKSSAKKSPRSRPGGAASLVGTIVGGRYRLLRVIGEGGMGAVYECEHVHMKKRSAVKVLHPDMSRVPEIVARFEREAMAAGHIDHPNVASATDFGKLDDGSFFLVLELVDGTSLRDVVAEGALSAQRALRIARQIASALARAHAHNIVHRDLKPENVLLADKDGEKDFVKVLDFGIAKVPVAEISGGVEGPALTQLGMVYGTPEYMAPEQAMGKKVDGRADLYALGVMLFEMLAGKRPFVEGDPVVLLGMHVSAPIPPLPGVQPDIEKIVRRLMAKQPNDRFDSAREVLEAIDTVLGVPPASQSSLPQASAATVLSGAVGARKPLLRHLAMNDAQKRIAMIGGGAFLGLLLLFAIVTALARRAHPPSAAVPLAPSSTSISIFQVDHRARCLEAAKKGEHGTSLDEATAYVDASPEAAQSDKDIADAVRAAANDPATEARAFELLETKLGAAGADALYDLAYGTSPNARAKRSIGDPIVKQHMSPVLANTVAIRESSNPCDAKKYFAEAAKSGDQRTLDAITPWLKKTGCGRRGKHDCWSCLRVGSDSVEKTADAIRARL